MNFKKITALCASFVLATGICASAKTLEFTMVSNYMFESTGVIETHGLETAPYTKNDRTMVPVRIISESFGADVDWDGEKNQVLIKKDGKDILLTLNSDIAIVNGEEIKLDVSPEEFNGRTMVPVRFISETLGMDVRYVPATEQVIITDNEPLVTIEGVDLNIDHYRSFMLALGYIGDEEDPLPYVNEATEYFKSVYGAGKAIMAEGEYSLGYDSEDIANTVFRYEDYMHDYNALTSTLAEVWDYENVVIAKVLNAPVDEAMMSEIDKIYSELFVTAKHILISADDTNKAEAKKKAEKVLQKAKAGEDFDKLIAEYNEDPGMEMSPDGYTFTLNEMVPEFEESAFSLKVGEISGLVETVYGYHIIKKEPLAPITDTIRESLSVYVAEERYNAYLSEGAANAQITVHKTDEQIAELFK